jgi:hypothetical protein
MTKYRIRKWTNISQDFTDKLLLGNGASRAVWEGFNYSSLFDVAENADRFKAGLNELFKDFGTTDFEYILKLLSQTRRVNEILHITDESTSKLYKRLKRALIDTVRDVHPTHEQVKNSLLPMARFMKRFSTVLSLNYDLLVYWSMLAGNDKYGKWFKDGFVDEYRFNNNYDYLREPLGADGATLVFYPHGNLILADYYGEELKIAKIEGRLLLDVILNIWEKGDHIPLFVSEGETTEKLQMIRRSNYLKNVYDNEVNSECESLVVYGWSFRDEDEHILKGIIKGGVKKIAVSVHLNPRAESFCETVQYKVNRICLELEQAKKPKNKPLLFFFDSASDDCWTNCLEEVDL